VSVVFNDELAAFAYEAAEWNKALAAGQYGGSVGPVDDRWDDFSEKFPGDVARDGARAAWTAGARNMAADGKTIALSPVVVDQDSYQVPTPDVIDGYTCGWAEP